MATVWAFTPLGEGTQRWPVTALYLVLAAFVWLHPSGTWVAATGLRVRRLWPTLLRSRTLAWSDLTGIEAPEDWAGSVRAVLRDGRRPKLVCVPASAVPELRQTLAENGAGSPGPGVVPGVGPGPDRGAGHPAVTRTTNQIAS